MVQFFGSPCIINYSVDSALMAHYAINIYMLWQLTFELFTSWVHVISMFSKKLRKLKTVHC